MMEASKQHEGVPSAAGAEQSQRKEEVMALLDRHPFVPPFWLLNAHVQTVGARYVRRLRTPSTQLERLRTPDNDFLRIHTIEGEAGKPIVLMLHGLEGSLESTYMLGLIREIRKLGWTTVVMEHRSCGGEMNRAKRLYHSGETSDLAFVVETLIRRRPEARIYVTGYSLGGNQTAKWLGEGGDAIPEAVRAVAVVSAPFDLVESGKYMDSGVRLLYVRHFLRMLIPKAVEKEQQYPGCVNIDAVNMSRTFREFDTHGTAALHGFRDSHDYYSKVGCGQFLHGIRRPTLLLSAADDPFNPESTLPREVADASPYLHPQFSSYGGHVGFIHGGPPRGLRYWAEEQIARFFQAYDDFER